MKPLLIFLCVYCLTIQIAWSSHVKGGEVLYQYAGPGSSSNTSKYNVTLRLFRDCNQPCGTNGVACLPGSVYLSLFVNGVPFTKTVDVQIPKSGANAILNLTTYPPCITSRPAVCTEVATYSGSVTVPDNNLGYILIFQTCCRVATNNLSNDPRTISGVPGATYEAIIPGKNILPTGSNSSAVFGLKDTALACKNSYFELDFSATDFDNDSLSYSFTAAYDGGSFTSAEDRPASAIDYKPTGYDLPFSSTQPLGDKVSINPVTGLISGIAPATGDYVVCVECYEWRNGLIIARHRKDFIFKVNDCSIPQPQLNPSYITCDGFNLSFSNLGSSALINTYYWDFGVSGTDTDTSTQPKPEFNFPDTGIYNITLIVNRGEQCTDTVSTKASVFPGFFPDFTVIGTCVSKPYQFDDKTITNYGVVNSWRWNFGDLTTTSDTSVLRNTQYLYSDTGLKSITLIVGNSKGCFDTIIKPLSIRLGPDIFTSFSDTLICAIDTLQLSVSSNSPNPTFSWLPAYNITSQTGSSPFVFPKVTTVYTATVNDGGCIDSIKVTVNVVDSVVLSLMPDTVICSGDTILVQNQSNGLQFAWSPPQGLSKTDIQEPFAAPLANTKYLVEASIGKCSNKDSINIVSVPYPVALAGPDSSICFGRTVQLSGFVDGNSFEWSPASTLVYPNTLTPLAGPQETTSYILKTFDTRGCPKPGMDTITVTVIPPIKAFAGNDTVVVIGQPLQLNGSGAPLYLWTPALYLDNPNIQNPVATFNTGTTRFTYTLTTSTPEGCLGRDSINILVYQVKPEIFIPDAFTPNGDGLNEIFKPTMAGLRSLTFFRIYNRWGQLLFETTQPNTGWNGKFNGDEQPNGAYVYTVQAIDYLGEIINKKGTFVLIR